MFLKFNQREFAIIVNGDETWDHFLKPIRKIGNKILLTRHSKRNLLTKNNKRKEGYLLHFFSCDGIAVQIPVPKGRSVTDR